MKKLYGALGVMVLLNLFLFDSPSIATQMNYTPVNPTFGGSPFNGASLLSEANANNHFAPQTASPLDAQQNFANTIQNAVLGQVSSQIASSIYGANSQLTGSITVGSVIYSWTTDAGTGERTLTTTNTITGQQLTITIPVSGVGR